MTAQIIQFRDYQIPRDLAPMYGDIETSLANLNRMAAEVFKALMIDTAAAEYSAPEKRPCVTTEDKVYRVGSLGNFAFGSRGVFGSAACEFGRTARSLNAPTVPREAPNSEFSC